MARSLSIDTESDVVRGIAMGLAFLVGLALNLDPERRLLALAVFGGGAVAFFGLAALAAIDDEYAGPQLRWYLFAGWGVLLFAVGVWTESAVSGIGGIVVTVYAAVRAWLFDALEESDEAEAAPEGAEAWDEAAAEANEDAADGDHPAARQPATQNRERQRGAEPPDADAASDGEEESGRERENDG